MCARFLAAAILVAPAVASDARDRARDEAPSEAGQAAWQLPAESREFDFWLGRWSLRLGAGGSGTAANTITSFGLGGGIAILEDYNQGTYRGTSVSYYSARTGNWHQLWLDNQGGLLEFAGGFENERMVLEGRVGGTLTRLVYSNITDRSLDFSYDLSNSGGAIWSTSFSARYTRVPGRTDGFTKGITAPELLPQAARQLDFWLGDWTVTAEEGLAGSNTVSTFGVGGGIAVLQHLTAAGGYELTSVSVYHPQERIWRHVSIDTEGTMLDLAGGPRSGVMIFEGELADLQTGATALARVSFNRTVGEDLEQKLEVSEDGGQVWLPRRTIRHFRSAIATPGDLRAPTVKKKKVVLEWNDTSAAEDRFELLRKEGEEWVPIETLAPGATSASLKKLRRRTTYTFGVRACAATECSEPAEITVTTR
jgi:hypothetical protein